MLSSDTRPLARTVTMAVQSSHVLAAIATIKVEQTRNAFIIQQLVSSWAASRTTLEEDGELIWR